MTSPFSCRARELTCHYGHVNRFCYLLTFSTGASQTSPYPTSDRQTPSESLTSHGKGLQLLNDNPLT